MRAKPRATERLDLSHGSDSGTPGSRAPNAQADSTKSERQRGGIDLTDRVPKHRIPREIAMRFAYLRRLVMTEMSRVLTPLGATVPQYNVLFRLAQERGAVSQQELTLDAGLDAAGVSRLVARMAEEKLVTVRVDARDRRRRLVKLTAKGRALEESLSPIIDGIVSSLVTGLTEEEEQLLLSLANRVVLAILDLEQRQKKGRRHDRSDPPAGIV